MTEVLKSGVTRRFMDEKELKELEENVAKARKAIKELKQLPDFIPLETPPLKAATGKIKTPAQWMMKGAKTVKFLEISNSIKDGSDLIPLTVASNARRTKALNAGGGKTTTQFSVDLNTANEVVPDTIYQIAGFTENIELLVKISTQGIRKLSSVIQFDAAVVVETLVFTVDASNNATVIADSVNMLNEFDILSFLPDGGVYYVLYTVYGGGGNAAIYLPSSSSYSENEPNDSAFQAPLRNHECYLTDTFDNGYDTDVIRIKITKTEPVAMSLTFIDENLSGQVNIGVYHKEDENGNSVNQWILYGTANVPAIGIPWENTSLKGEFYIYVQYISGNILNQEYRFAFTPLSKMQIPQWIETGEYGLTGAEYGMVGIHHWVIGSFKVKASFNSNSAFFNRTETGEYPLVPTMLRVVGQDSKGNFDYENNTFYSEAELSDKWGYVTLGALLPATYGQDGSFSGYKYTHSYDYNIVDFFSCIILSKIM